MMMRHSTTVRVIRSMIACRTHFSESGSPAVDKLRAIMEEYRQTNYSQDIPTRFVKEVLEAADKNKDGVISVAELQTLLTNIGASDQLSTTEILDIFGELGLQNPQPSDGIPIPKIKSIIIPQKK